MCVPLALWALLCLAGLPAAHAARATPHWELTPKEQQTRNGHGTAVVDDICIVFGGMVSGGNVLNDVYLYDPQTYSSSPVTTTGTPPAARAFFSMNVVGRKLIIFGGSTFTSSPFDDIFLLDVDTWAWR